MSLMNNGIHFLTKKSYWHQIFEQ